MTSRDNHGMCPCFHSSGTFLTLRIMFYEIGTTVIIINEIPCTFKQVLRAVITAMSYR